MASSYNELFGLGSHSEDANLEGWWPLQDDAASTTVDDASSNGRDGTLVGAGNTSDAATTGPNSYLTGALAFDGSNDWITVSSVPMDAVETNNAYTLGGWAKAVNLTGDYAMFGQWGDVEQFQFWVDYQGSGDGWASVISDNGNRIAGTNDSNASTNWDFAVSRWTGTSLGARVNGVDGTQLSYTGSIGSSTGVLTIADDLPNGTKEFYGDLSGLFIFSRALTDAEVDEIEDGPEPVYSSGVSFGSDGAYNVGTWGLDSPFSSGSNGSITYEVVASNAAGSTIDSDTSATGTLDLSSEAGNTVYLLVRASNTGGYDTGDHGSRTSSFGSANDGYYELASVTAASGGETGAITEAIGLSDSFDFLAELEAQWNESVEVADTQQSQTLLEAALTEAIEVGESWIALLNRPGVLTENKELGDTQTAIRSIVSALTESIESGDTFIASSALKSALSAGTDAGDSFASSLALFAAITESAELNDTLNTDGSVSAATTDTANFDDSVSPQLTTLADTNDSLSVTDDTAGQLTALSETSDSGNLGDTLEPQLTSLADISEGVELNDSHTGVVNASGVSALWSESIELDETISPSLLSVAALSEVMQVSENYSCQTTITSLWSDNLLLAETFISPAGVVTKYKLTQRVNFPVKNTHRVNFPTKITTRATAL